MVGDDAGSVPPLSAGEKPVFDEAPKARAYAKQAAIQKEWERWGRKAPVKDRIIISAWMPSIEAGDWQEIEQVSICLPEQAQRGRASASALRYLAAHALRKCLERSFPAPLALLETAAHLLEPKGPRYKRARPEERQRAIAFIIENPKAGRRAIAQAAGMSDSAVRKWLNDPHFIDEVNERAGKTILCSKTIRATGHPKVLSTQSSKPICPPKL